MNEQCARWLVANTDAASVSLDGMKTSHDRQRPKKDGSGSFDDVCRTLAIFDEAGFHYVLRATITKESAQCMSEMIEYFSHHFQAAEFQFDPLLFTGRCHTSDCQAASDQAYIYEFLRACDLARTKCRKLGFSILSPTAPRTYYCCASANGFTITHDGYLTSCFECVNPESPYAEHFVYGRYDGSKRSFIIDEDKVEKLNRRHVHNMDKCAKCFCKYMCCGDCVMNNLRHTGDMYSPARCRTVQTIAKYRLAGLVSDLLDPMQFCAEQMVQTRNTGRDFRVESYRGHRSSGEPQVHATKQFRIRESSYMIPPSPMQTARELVSRGNANYRQVQYALALSRYDKAIEAYEGLAMAHNNRGLTLHKLGRLDEAVKAIERALSLEPEDSAFHLNLGKVQVSRGHLQRGLRAFDDALEHRPAWGEAFYNKLWVLIEIGGLKEATCVVSRLLEADSHPEGTSALLSALSIPATEKMSEANCEDWLQDFNHSVIHGGVELMAPGARPPMCAAIAAFSREQYSEARQLVKTVLRHEADSPLPYWLSAMAWQADGNSKKADTALSHAMSLMPRLSVEPVPEANNVLLNGKPVPQLGKPFSVFPRSHKLSASLDGKPAMTWEFSIGPREERTFCLAELCGPPEGQPVLQTQPKKLDERILT